jgi:hypothetical protein
MLARTHTPLAPWTCIHTDDKKLARINLLRHLLLAIASPSLAADVEAPDPTVAYPFEAAALRDGRLEP